MEDGGSVPQGAADVVGHHHHGHALGAVEIPQGAVQVVGGGGVQARHRFVQHQQVPCRAQGPGQQHPLLLAAGQFPIALVLQLQNAQLAHVLQGLGLLGRGIEEFPPPGAEKAGQHHLADGGGKVLLCPGLLGQIADGPPAEAFVQADLPGQGPQQAQHALEQGGLAGAVVPHDAQIIPPAHLKGQMLPDGAALVAQGRVTAVYEHLLFAHANPSFSTSTFFHIRDRYVSPPSNSCRVRVWQE